MVGWGKAEFDRPHENQPRQLWLTTWANAACFLKNSKLADISSENTFCAGVDVDAGTCFGDSGSGMFMKLDTRHYFLRGIVSSGFEDETKQSCDVKAGSIFTDVLKYTEWINQVAFERDTIIPKLSQEPTFVAKPKNYDKEIFCFFESWANGRAGDGSFTVNHLKPELCTHLVFLHADMEDDNLKSINEWEHTDINGLKLFKVFNDLKRTYRLKTLLAMGSWNEGSVKYSQLSADPERRKKFAENSAEYLKENGFDGLHFHWEHPAHRGGAREDKANFVLLLKDIKKVYQKKNLNLTALVRVQDDVVEKAYDLPNISKHVDRIMMMDFDLAGYWDGKVGFPAAIRGEAAYTLESRVNFFISSGVPAEKIILGVPFFGRTFMSPTAGNVGDPSQDGFAGPFFQEKGFLGYNEFCHMRKTKTWDLSYDETASQAIGKNKEGSLTNVVIYDSPRVLVNKVKFVADKKLSGVWTWFVDSDDFRGDCEPETTTFADFPNARVPARKEKDFPLLRTINDAMAIFSPKIVQEIDQREPATPKPFPGISPRPSSINKAGVEGSVIFDETIRYGFDMFRVFVLGSRPVGFSGVGDPFDLTQTLIFKH